MTIAITKRTQAWRGNGFDQIHVTMSVSTSSIVNTTFSAAGTFAKAFSITPLVLGVNTDRPGQTATALVTATTISVYVSGASPTLSTDGTVLVTVLLEGPLTGT